MAPFSSSSGIVHTLSEYWNEFIFYSLLTYIDWLKTKSISRLWLGKLWEVKFPGILNVPLLTELYEQWSYASDSQTFQLLSEISYFPGATQSYLTDDQSFDVTWFIPYNRIIILFRSRLQYTGPARRILPFFLFVKRLFYHVVNAK